MRVLLLALFLTASVRAQEPLFASPDPQSNLPRFVETIGDHAYFLADAVPDPTQVTGMWRTDGTQAGTEYLNGLNWLGRLVLAVDGTVYFLGLDSPENGGSGPTDLYRLDGTTPVRLSSFPAGSILGPPTFAGGRVFFSASPSSSAFNAELYAYAPADGSVTRYDLNPASGAGGPRSSSPFAFTVAGETLYFLADTADSPTPSDARGLWRVTPSGTPTEVAARPGTDLPFELAALGETVIAAGDDGLYRFDGNALVRFADFSGAREMTVFGDYVYFRGDAATDSPDVGLELWRTDGTTVDLVADILPTIGTQALGSTPSGLYAHRGWLYFAARTLPPGSSTLSPRLWRTDGTTTERLPEFDLSYGPVLVLDDEDNEFTSYGHDLAFRCMAPGVGTTVCILDATTLRIHALDFPESVRDLSAVGERLVFTARSGSVGNDLHVYAPEAEPVSSVPVPAPAGNDRRIQFYNSVGLDFSLSNTPEAGTVTGRRFSGAPADRTGLPSDASIACRWNVTASDGATVDWTDARVEIRVSAQPQCFGTDPTIATLYWRPTPGQGSFTALTTSAPSYESVRRLRFTGTLGFGEYALASSSVSTPTESPLAPEARSLVLAGPNPASGETRLRVNAAPGEWVTVTLHDALGRQVATIHNGPAGTVRLPLADLAPGVYLARMDGADAIRLTVTR